MYDMGGPSLGLLGGAGLPQGGREGGKLGVRTHALHMARRACNLIFAPRLLGQDFFFFIACRETSVWVRVSRILNYSESIQINEPLWHSRHVASEVTGGISSLREALSLCGFTSGKSKHLGGCRFAFASCFCHNPRALGQQI